MIAVTFLSYIHFDQVASRLHGLLLRLRFACFQCNLFIIVKIYRHGTSTGPKVIKLFMLNSTESTKFQLLITLKYQQIKKFLDFILSEVVFIMLINV